MCESGGQLGGHHSWCCAETLPVRHWLCGHGGSGAAALVQREPWNLLLFPSEVSCSESQMVGRRQWGTLRAPHCSPRAASHADLSVGHRQELRHLGRPGHTHRPAKSSQSFFSALHWLLGSGFDVPSLAPRSLPWHRHDGTADAFCSLQPFAHKYQLNLFQWEIWGARGGHPPGRWFFMAL